MVAASGKKVLYVDDSETDRRVVERMLSKIGFVVTTASCMEEALEIAQKQKFDIYLSDGQYPEAKHGIINKTAGLKFYNSLKKLLGHSFAFAIFSGDDRLEELADKKKIPFIKKSGFEELIKFFKSLNSHS